MKNLKLSEFTQKCKLNLPFAVRYLRELGHQVYWNVVENEIVGITVDSLYAKQYGWQPVDLDRCFEICGSDPRLVNEDHIEAMYGDGELTRQ